MAVKIIIFLALATVALFQNCSQSQKIFGDTCLDECPPDTVYTFSNGVMNCQICDVTKFFILSPDQSRCQCALQTFYSPILDMCIPCHYSCLTCRGQQITQCLTCDTQVPTTFRVRDGSKCVCPRGYFDNVDQAKCIVCHSDCKNCTGPQDTDCITCAKGRQKNQFNQCVCDNGFTEDDDGNCVCPSPLIVFFDGTCKDAVSECGFGEQNTAKIKAKDNNPKNIAQAAKRSCSCKAGLVKIKGKCKTCKQNEVYNQKKGKCQCVPEAKKYQKQCIVCPSNQQFNKKTGQCDCKKNSQKTQNGDCIKCPKKTIYKGGGVCGCIANYYLEKNGKCKKCSKRSDDPGCQQNVHGIDKPRALDRKQLKK